MEKHGHPPAAAGLRLDSDESGVTAVCTKFGGPLPVTELYYVTHESGLNLNLNTAGRRPRPRPRRAAEPCSR